MSHSVLTFLASLLICAACVSAECNDKSFGELRKCIYTSSIYNNVLFPRNVTAVDKFCMDNVNTTYNCLRNIQDECADNTKQAKLLKLTVDLKAFRMKLDDFCSKKAELGDKADCLSNVFGGDAYKTCVRTAIGTEINAGNPKDVKTGLNTDCKFFDAFATCHTEQFTGDCNSVGTQYASLIEGARYPYCGMSVVEKEKAILEYNATGGASLVVCSLSAIFLGITAWISL